MPADLVTLDEMKDWMRVGTTDEDDELQDVLDAIEEALEEACDRVRIPFQAAELARAEVRDGTGNRDLFLDYPITTVTTIELGRDPANRDDTLDPTDVDEVIWIAGSRRITRTDGGKWGKYRSPLFVNVTYDAQADLPELARVAVIQVVAGLWRQRGGEGVKSSKILDVGTTFLKVMDETPAWAAAVKTLKRYAFV